MQTAEFSKLKEMSSTMLESLRALRTNIQFCGDDVKTILFTSTIPDEGKSTVVLDLARSDTEFGLTNLDGVFREQRYVVSRAIYSEADGNCEGYVFVIVASHIHPSEGDRSVIKTLLQNHQKYTGSKKAKAILDDFDGFLPKFKKIIPEEYKKIISSEDVRR